MQRVDAKGQPHGLEFLLDDPDPILGSRLRIELPPTTGDSGSQRLRIDYRTSGEASALQWLEPAQTSGPHPYLYSQGQAIHTRSWIPLQDTPSVRVTYDARIHTPRALVAVMSAARVDPTGSPAGEYRFEMRQPIPSYLIALTIGDRKFRALEIASASGRSLPGLRRRRRNSPNSRDAPAGEKMIGPYRWDRYDLLIMPHSLSLAAWKIRACHSSRPRLSPATAASSP